ncbi:MAG: PHP domain-containing protein [Defluviitaleaceae bacterium]|nr:PHP domain-containing protein [Defluviitaleaceae bacterium]
MIDFGLIEALNAGSADDRLNKLRGLVEKHRDGTMPAMHINHKYVNNHIHTDHSFSPYSPTAAAYAARVSGLAMAGVMDHDTLSGAGEFIDAGKIIGLPVTVGLECRCQMGGTPFDGRRVNNPDQNSIAYLALHGIPRQSMQTAQDFFRPYRAARNRRNRLMTEKLDSIAAPLGVRIDFDGDVIPVSRAASGGTVTERHILYALSLKLVEKFGRGAKLENVLCEAFGLAISAGNKSRLNEARGPLYAYVVLNVLKGGLARRFYIDAREECPPVGAFLELAKKTGGIAAYAYLGDVTDSVTGDKSAQAFEDGYLDDLFGWLASAGFDAVTYMPARNTPAQLCRVALLCERNKLFQISGEDINSPFQSFVCGELQKKEYAHLADSAWALVGHEEASINGLSEGMFSKETVSRTPDLGDRIRHFAKLARDKNTLGMVCES